MLHWPTIVNCPGQIVVVTDALASPGDFILHDLVGDCARVQDAYCVLVSLDETFDHWKIVASRLSPPANLLNARANGRLVFINSPLQIDAADLDEAFLHGLHDQIESALGSNLDDTASTRTKKTMVVLDGLTSLHWVGLPLLKIRRFLRALCRLCRKTTATLVVRIHRTISTEHDELLQSILQVCSLHIEVLPLSSGRSGAISGEIAIHHGPLGSDNAASAICRSRAVQYRLADSGAVYFERGTAAGVL